MRSKPTKSPHNKKARRGPQTPAQNSTDSGKDFASRAALPPFSQEDRSRRSTSTTALLICCLISADHSTHPSTKLESAQDNLRSTTLRLREHAATVYRSSSTLFRAATTPRDKLVASQSRRPTGTLAQRPLENRLRALDLRATA